MLPMLISNMVQVSKFQMILVICLICFLFGQYFVVSALQAFFVSKIGFFLFREFKHFSSFDKH